MFLQDFGADEVRPKEKPTEKPKEEAVEDFQETMKVPRIGSLNVKSLVQQTLSPNVVKPKSVRNCAIISSLKCLFVAHSEKTQDDGRKI